MNKAKTKTKRQNQHKTKTKQNDANQNKRKIDKQIRKRKQANFPIHLYRETEMSKKKADFSLVFLAQGTKKINIKTLSVGL